MMTEVDNDTAPTEQESASALSDVLGGVVFLALGGVMWGFTSHLSPMIPGTLVGPALLPRICAIGFAVLGAVLLGKSLWRLKSEDRAGEGRLKLGLRTFLSPAVGIPVLLIAVWLLAPVLGLYFMAALAGLVLSRALGGTWLGSAICVGSICLAIYFLFTMVMRIQMPHGLIY